MKDFMKVMGSLIDRILGYMLAIMFAISFFIKDVSTIILSGVLLTGFTIMSIYVENVSRKLDALKELEKILWKTRTCWMKKIKMGVLFSIFFSLVSYSNKETMDFYNKNIDNLS